MSIRRGWVAIVGRASVLVIALLAAACGEDGASSGASGAGGGSGGGSASSSSGTGGGSSGESSSAASSSSSGAGGGAGGGAGLDCKNLPLCDDFEGASVGAPPDPSKWMVVSPNCSGAGSLAVDSSEAHSGTKSLKVTGGGGYCDHVFIANTAAVPSIGGAVYGRFFVRFEAALGAGHTTFMTMKDSADSNKDLRMGGQSNILMWNRESDDATLPVLSPAGIAKSLAPAPQAWVCVEFMVDPAGLLTTWVDGASVDGLVVDASSTPDVDQQWLTKAWKPALTDFKLGWESYAGQALTLWFDDVALGSARVGCK